jgi:hypothetical protein
MKKSLWAVLTILLSVPPHPYAATTAKPAALRENAPLVLFPPCPCYHAIGVGNGNTRLDADVHLEPAQRAGARLDVELLGTDGKPLQNASADASREERVGVDLRVPNQSAGVFKIRVRLLNGTGVEIAKADTDVRVAPLQQSTVKLQPDGFLQIAGKPEFVIGMYQGGRLPEMAAAGFTASHNYQITTGDADETINQNDLRLKTTLDNCWSNGLRMMVELPRKAIEKSEWQQVTRRIQTFKYHPGLLCWGSEERVARGLTSITNIATLYQLVHQLDPDHPLVLGDTRDKIQKFKTDRRDFFPDPYMDIGIWWWYPIPLKEPDANGLLEGREKTGPLLTPPAWLTTTISKKPLWIAIQSYQRPKEDARFPTPAEYRCMAYLSIINGVKGLWFYTGSGQKDWQGKPSGLFNKPEEGHWDYVQKLVRELRDFSPVIMAPKAEEQITMSPSDAPVEFATRKKEGHLYILAANKSAKSQKVNLEGAGLNGKRMTLLLENSATTVKTTDGVSFEPFGVHVFRVN